MEKDLNLNQDKTSKSILETDEYVVNDVEIDEEVTIKIQTLDNIYPMTISMGITIQTLKQKIFEKFGIDSNRQKIIFQGRVLCNNEIIRSCRITEGSVLHLLVKPLEDNNSITNNNEGVYNSESDQGGRLNMEEMLNSVIEIPIIRSRRRRRRPNTTFDISESIEAMHQNIVTINSVISSRVKFSDAEVFQTKCIAPFDFSKFKFEKGQWLDAKDSIDQWIEAQVVHVQNNQAYIHYNGWGTRWDEWIDFSSPRLAPFKTYSINTNPGGCYSSPYPAIVPDANIEPLQRNLEAFYYIDKAYSFIGEVQKTIEQMYRCKKRKNNDNSSFLIKMTEDREKELKHNFEKRFQQTSKEEQAINTSILNELRSKAGISIDPLANDNFVGKEFLKEETYSHSHQTTQNLNTNFGGLNSNDLELLHLTTQLVPLMDRVGRYISDVSLHLSYLMTNPNLYPRLILGNSNFNDDNLSCTSGYSMYTNEGSNFTGGVEANTNLLNNLQRITTVQNSNQVIRNYPHNIRTSTHSGGNNNTSNHQINYNDFPKINLQLPAVQHANLTQNAYSEPNIDIYVHTYMAPQQLMRTRNVQAQSNNITSSLNNDVPVEEPTTNVLLQNNNNINNILSLINIGGDQSLNTSIQPQTTTEETNQIQSQLSNQQVTSSTFTTLTPVQVPLTSSNVTGINRINELHHQRQNRFEFRNAETNSISSVNSNTHSVCSNIRRNLEPSPLDQQIKIVTKEPKERE